MISDIRFRYPVWKAFAPRVGFARDVQGNGKTVVRSAFGIFNLTIPLNMIRTSNSGSAFRSFAVDILAPPSFDDPYLNYPGGNPYPFTEPPVSALKTSTFPSPLVTTLLDPYSNQGYAEEWNFTVERQILPDLGLSASYVGNHQLGVMATYQANPARYAPGATEANVQSRGIYPAFGALGVASSSWEHANYNALQVSLTKHLQHGLSLLGNYSYLKCMDNDSGATIGVDAGGGDAFNDKFNLNDGDSRCDFDVTHSANAALVYALPQDNALHGFAGKLVNGWQATPIITIRSGNPFTVSTGETSRFPASPTRIRLTKSAPTRRDLRAPTNFHNGLTRQPSWKTPSDKSAMWVGTASSDGEHGTWTPVLSK